MSKEAMKLALEALENAEYGDYDKKELNKAIIALREALAEKPVQQEPHLFEFWWCEHMPEATQNQAWKAWISAPRHNKVGVAKPEQEPEHIVRSNGRYSPLLTHMMNERVKSNVKQVIELYDSPDQPAPPPDCKTEAEKTAYAFGWFKALESVREKPAQQEGVMVGGWGRVATKKLNDLQDKGYAINGVSIATISEDGKTVHGAVTTGGMVLWWNQERPPAQQEPVGEAYLCDRCQTPFDGAYECPSCGHHTAVKEPVYTSPPAQRTWVGLTDEEMRLIDPDGFEDNLPQMIQQALKEKNT